MARYSGIPFVQAGAHGSTRVRTQMIVIHATANTASAEAEASYMRFRPDGVSVHFFSDSDSTIQVLDTGLVAYGCYPTGNARSVQFELCGLNNQISDATMREAAPWVAKACAEFGIPIRKITPAQLRASVLGICGHADVTAAWGEGDHTDPGLHFPWDTFIGYVQRAAHPAPPVPTPNPTPEPTPTPRRHVRQLSRLLEDDMSSTPPVLVRFTISPEVYLCCSATVRNVGYGEYKFLLEKGTPEYVYDGTNTADERSTLERYRRYDAALRA